MHEHEYRLSRPIGLSYRRVVDMRAVGPRGKVLIFADNTTWLMRRQHLIFRPILPLMSGE